MVTQFDLYDALRRLLEVTSDKAYRTWLETSILREARALCTQFECENPSLEVPPELKPHEERTFQDGQRELEWAASPATLPDAAAPEIACPASAPEPVTPHEANISIWPDNYPTASVVAEVWF